MKTKLHNVFSLLMIFCGITLFAQSNQWKKSTMKIPYGEGTAKYHLDSNKVEYFELNEDSFKQDLISAPLRGERKSSTLAILPSSNGAFETFRIYEAPVFSPSLSAQYPDIKSYVGFSTESTAILRMSVAPSGIQTTITYKDGPAVFMMPLSHGSNHYVVYTKKDKYDYDDQFVCSTMEDFSRGYQEDALASRDANDQTLRKYRLAVSVNGEYTIYHGGTVAGALAAINATITRVNAVFETDMAITFELVDATQLIYTNPSTDPYSNNLNQWNGQLQNTLNNTIGNGAYDVGHMFGASGGGGNAGCIGCVCEAGIKGSGITSPADGIPEGDNFDIDYVAHEIGHQMGANHTFAYNIEGTGVNSEPGSGTTIMGYAGITGSNDVQQHSDPYFHYHSINQILNNVASAPNNCAVTTSISNNPPNANAGSDYHIPPGTAYVLRGSATDPDGGDSLTYCWEQTNSGTVTNSSFGPTLTNGSMNRSLPPVSSPDRYIPNLDRVVANQLTETNPTIGDAWETVSNVARTMNWALTVRDREPTATGLNGQSSFDLMTITVENVSPFVVSSPNGGELWTEGQTQTVTWNVGQTTNGTINAQNVNVLLSVDGGYTYPYTLATNTANDGSEDIIVPNVISSNARVKVEPVNNIFYDISNTDFTIATNSPNFYFVNSGGSVGTCGATSVTFNLDYYPINGFNETTTFSASGNPVGSNVVFSPSSISSEGPFTMTINNLGAAAEGDYTIAVTGTSPSITYNTDVTLTVIDGLCTSVANTTYDTSTTLVQFNTINNPSGKPSGYSDYTSISTDVNRDSAYDLNVNMNTDGNYLCRTTVWIDWNQNCIFDDNEAYDLGQAVNTPNGPSSNSPVSVVVPSDAVIGSTTMRVTTKYSSSASACENGHDAEVEDYTINVLESLSTPDFSFNHLSIFPNPNNGSFTIKFNPASNDSDISIRIYDIRGRTIFDNIYENNQSEFIQTINLNEVQSGIYLVSIKEGQKQEVKRIIID
ncbi:MAG: zinc-dependent metalloprotease [Mangrovimonas sp.]|nr:zinc-dependent metalloprotease [Mangrovimonas sp.]MCB0426326.1 zinc-dependent metalloprotease [Mangrovimonas sp.]